MVKLVVKQPGVFVTLPNLGSFRSPFEVRIPESLRPLVEAELLKNGIKNFKVSKDELPIKKKQVEKEVEIDEEEIEQPEKKVTVDLTDIYKRLDTIQELVNRVLNKGTTIREVIIQKEGPSSLIIKEPEIEEEIFIPRLSEKISVIDLTVKTAEKDDISDQVESLLNLKK